MLQWGGWVSANRKSALKLNFCFANEIRFWFMVGKMEKEINRFGTSTRSSKYIRLFNSYVQHHGAHGLSLVGSTRLARWTRWRTDDCQRDKHIISIIIFLQLFFWSSACIIRKPSFPFKGKKNEPSGIPCDDDDDDDSLIRYTHTPNWPDVLLYASESGTYP